MGLMVLEATGFRADSGLFIPLSQVPQMSGLAVPLVVVVIRLWMLVRHCPLGGPSPGMDTIATELALLAIDRLTRWVFCLNPTRLS